MHPTDPPSVLRRFIYLPIGIGLLIITSLVGYGYLTGERMHAVESPLLKIIYEIKLESTATRFLIEEALDGEETLDHDLAWGYLEQAVVYLKYLHESEWILPVGFSAGDFADFSLSIERLSSALMAWKDLSARIYSPRTRQSTDSRDELAGALSDFSKALSEIEKKVHKELEAKKTLFRSVQAVLIGTFILIALGVAAAVRYYEREKSGNILRLTEMNRLLREEVSRRETMEGTLAEREQLFRNVFNDSPVSIIIARLADMRIVDVNKWFVDTTGFKKEEIIARPLHDTVIFSDPASREKLRQWITEHHQLKSVECSLPVKNGKNRTILLSSTVTDIEGEGHILSVARDITEFKAAEMTLRQSEKKFRSLFESSPDFNYLLDPQGRILMANPAVQDRLAFSEHEFVGRPLADLLSPESRRNFVDQLPELLRKGNLRTEYDILTHAGERIAVDCSGTTLKNDDGVEHIILVQKDITERRRNERKFKSLYQFLEAATRNEDLQPMLANFLEVIESATGCAAAAIRVENEDREHAFFAIKGFDPGSCQPDRLHINHQYPQMCVHLNESSGKACTSCCCSPNGSFFRNSPIPCPEIAAEDFACPVHAICGWPLHESFALIPIRDSQRIIGLIHIAYREKNRILPDLVDLLETAAKQLGAAIQRFRAEEALKCSHHELERRVRERTEQLTATNEQLKAEIQERTLTEHSLVQHQAQLRKLSSGLIQTEERERHRIATAIHEGVGQTLAAAKIKLAALRSSISPDVWEGQVGEVRGLVSLAIEETRSLTFELSPPVLYEIGLKSALEWMAERFQRKFGLPIIIDANGYDRQLDIPYRVFAFQSVRELCFNAVKHARASRVAVSILEDGEFICIEVADDGAGFDIKKQHKADGDMGFGLFSIREQLRHYGGTLTLESQPGIGTRVVLRLPLKNDALSKGGEARHDSSAVGGGPPHRP